MVAADTDAAGANKGKNQLITNFQLHLLVLD
jgi:hypothetical protein